MFDFEKLQVYAKAKILNKEVQEVIKSKSLDRALGYQLERSSLSIVLNIAEGAGRYYKTDKRNLYIRARGSAYECIAMLDILKDDNILKEDDFKSFYSKYEELCKMLSGLVASFQKKEDAPLDETKKTASK